MCEIKLIISFLSKHDGFCLSDLAIEWKCISDKKKLTPVKVIIDKSRGEVSILEQDTIENVSFKKSEKLCGHYDVFKIFLTFLLPMKT